MAGEIIGLCNGRAPGHACSKHADCTVGYACRREKAWPHRMSCMPQAPVEALCDSDYDCKNNLVCWFKTAGNSYSQTGHCMEIFGIADGGTFGWNDTVIDEVDNAILNGKVCSSGYAYNAGNRVGTCAPIVAVREGTAIPTATLASPYQCDATNALTTCFYQYDAVNYHETPC